MKRMTALKAIRLKCLDCSVYQPSEISKCTAIGCSLYPYRFGKKPREDWNDGEFFIEKYVHKDNSNSNEEDDD